MKAVSGEAEIVLRERSERLGDDMPGCSSGRRNRVARYRFRLEVKTPAGLGWGGRLGARGGGGARGAGV